MRSKSISFALLLLATACSQGGTIQKASLEVQGNAKKTSMQGIEAAKRDDAAALKLFLAKGGDPNVLDHAGLGALHYAAVHGNLPITRLLVQAGAKLNADPSTAYPSSLHLAAQGGHPDVVEFLFQKGANLNAVWFLNGHTPLIEAAFDARVEVVALLLKKGADTGGVTLRGLTASDFAAREADRNPAMKQILELLNAHNRKLGLTADSSGKFDYSAEQKTQRLAVLLDHIDPPRRLTAKEQHIADIQKQLQTAGEKGELAEVKRLVEVEGASVNLRAGRLGSTPLILASVAGKEDVVAYLLAKGANPNLHELHPMAISALFKAAVFGHSSIAQKLLQSGALVNEQGPANGMTPLHDAVFRRRVDVVKLLLSFGADPKLQDYTGRTAKDLAKGLPELEVLFERSI